MQKKICLMAVVIISCVAVTSIASACHSNYFNKMFLTLEKMREGNELTSDQISSMWELADEFKSDWHKTARAGKPNSALDPYVERFVAAAAGVLDSEQYTKMTGKKKTEVQELRYEVNQLRKELEELREMIAELKKARSK